MAQTSRSNPAIGGAVPTQYDLMLALARKIVSGEEGDLSADEADEETVEAVFAQAGDAEAVAEDLLVDEGWRTLEVEPEMVEADVSADNGTNGTGVALDIGATNGHAEVDEPEQAVLTWAELFAKEVTYARSRRRRKPPQPASLSLFEWALSVEQEREEELVGADR